MKNRKSIISMDVNITDATKVFNHVETLASKRSGAYICVSNVHMCIETYDCPDFEDVVNKADLVIPDGKPLSIALRLLGYKDAAQVRGQDIMNDICSQSGRKDINIGFYGGSSNELLESVKANLIKIYPDINIVYSHSPPFRPLTAEEDLQVVKEINDSGVNVLFVGIGCPKQERWMAEHKASLNCVMLGVGAAYDFIAGSKKHAPRWIQKIGMEWMFRLCCEPKRLWKRYSSTNPRFLWLFGKQFLRYRLYNDDGEIKAQE
ncbi:WecB/TagA/CpsF family glycosyltransferase [Vibrio sp. WJH972]